jgi:arsenate reductase-like glutaredoxin family protein
LKKNNIEYTEKNASDSEVAEELLGLGYRTTPVIVSDKGTIVGYSPSKLSEVFL